TPLVVDFPSWETLPGEEIAPSPDLVGKRFEVLHSLLSHKKPHVVLAPLQAVLQKLPNPSTLERHCRRLKKEEHLPFSAFPDQLRALGFIQRPIVSDK